MIIDDEKEMLVSLRKILSRSTRFELKLMQDGQAAIEELQKEKYDGVICDLKMPNLSGLDILREVKTISPETFVIIISGYGTIESSVEAMRLGAFDFIENRLRRRSC